MGVLVPTAVAATALGITPDAIRLLRHRGKLSRHGTKQRALVDIDELITLTGAKCTDPIQYAETPTPARPHPKPAPTQTASPSSPSTSTSPYRSP